MLEQEFLNNIAENRGIIFKIINLYTDNDEDRKDLYQEIIYQGWRSYKNFKGNSKFSTWLTE
jgi:RNA polymerase sigma-70 factor (ECF subfamily)